FRYLLERVGPALRQYIVTGNDEERPFSRDQRRWVYASSKKENNYFGFGTDSDLEQTPGHLVIRHAPFPLLDPHKGDPAYDEHHRAPCAKVLGGWRNRARRFRPASIVNVSGMSYGSLSAAAVEAINRGSALAGCWQSTGEGGISPHHKHGGDLVWQVGTGYFGCRDAQGRFSQERFLETLAKAPSVRAVEIKLSQGAKPGAGGILPAAKITQEIVEIRGIPFGKDCVSPSAHTAFRDTSELLDFAERLSEAAGGIPVGIKSAVGQGAFWTDLARQMDTTGRGVDFITIDGGEGGTGAAPLAFSDHVSLPFKLGFSQVYRAMAERGLHHNVVFNGSGKLGFPEQVLFAFALGCDLVAVAREAMLAIGCIQAQECHTGHCPTGIATQNRWLMRGLDPTHKAARLANYMVTLRKEVLALCRASGVPHPAFITGEHLDLLGDRFGTTSVREAFGYPDGWGLPAAADLASIRALMEGPPGSRTPPRGEVSSQAA
ncbi:MAG: FMN-binding glutamate synthase family protein, partial [Deltaproteobacteria bacterium]|nr:FMN-binding glutamate synthase family protein [Deltaproteobacteria bacterium]